MLVEPFWIAGSTVFIYYAAQIYNLLNVLNHLSRNVKRCVLVTLAERVLNPEVVSAIVALIAD